MQPQSNPHLKFPYHFSLAPHVEQRASSAVGDGLKECIPVYKNQSTVYIVTPASLTYDLLCCASYDVIDAACAANLRQPKSPALGLLARIGLWLRLLWGSGGVVSEPLYYRPAPAPNRAQLRRGRRSAPLGRQLCALAPLLWRVHGRARYERFLYDLGSYGRVKFCFQNWNWRWASRLCFLSYGCIYDADTGCHAPLFPD